MGVTAFQLPNMEPFLGNWKLDREFDCKIKLGGAFTIHDYFKLGIGYVMKMPILGGDVRSMVTISAEQELVFTKTKEDSETVTQCVLVEEGKEMEIVKTLTKEDGTVVVAKQKMMREEEEDD